MTCLAGLLALMVFFRWTVVHCCDEGALPPQHKPRGASRCGWRGRQQGRGGGAWAPMSLGFTGGAGAWGVFWGGVGQRSLLGVGAGGAWGGGGGGEAGAWWQAKGVRSILHGDLCLLGGDEEASVLSYIILLPKWRRYYFTYLSLSEHPS